MTQESIRRLSALAQAVPHLAEGLRHAPSRQEQRMLAYGFTDEDRARAIELAQTTIHTLDHTVGLVVNRRALLVMLSDLDVWPLIERRINALDARGFSFGAVTDLVELEFTRHRFDRFRPPRRWTITRQLGGWYVPALGRVYRTQYGARSAREASHKRARRKG